MKLWSIPVWILLLALLPHLMGILPSLYYQVAKPPYSEVTSGSVLITGASRGIGKDIALYLDSQGFKVYAGVRREKSSEELKKLSKSIIPLVLDINNDEQIAAALKTISADSTKLVGIVNNAAILQGGPFEALTPDQIRQTYNTNLVSTAVLTNQFLPLLRQNQGRIVMISSLAEEFPTPFMGVYPSTKTGISGLCEFLRRELAPYGVHVANVQPGVVLTDMMTTNKDPNYWKEGIEGEKLKELETVYGSYYSKHNQEYLDEMMYSLPMQAEDVSKAVHHALSSPAPKPEYLLSGHSYVIQILRNLPTWFQDWYVDKLIFPGPNVQIPKK